MQVEVEHRDAIDAARRAQRFGRHDESVEGAESFAVVCVRVVEAARERRGDAVVERARRRGQRSAVRQQHRGPQRGRPRELLRLGERTRLAATDRLDVRETVDAKQVGDRDRRRRLDADAGATRERVGDQLELPHRHHVVADRRREARVVVGRDHAVGGSSRNGAGRPVHTAAAARNGSSAAAGTCTPYTA